MRIYLSELASETRLTRCGTAAASNDAASEFPLLTELFFLAHTALRLSFPPLMALHSETNRQLHQWEQEALSRSPTTMFGGPPNPYGGLDDESQEGRFIQYCLRERTSRFLEQNASLGCATRLHAYLAFAVTTCRFLGDIVEQPSGEAMSQLVLMPEFLVDNVVELVSYLRRLNDDFLEVSCVFFVFESGLYPCRGCIDQIFSPQRPTMVCFSDFKAVFHSD